MELGLAAENERSFGTSSVPVHPPLPRSPLRGERASILCSTLLHGRENLARSRSRRGLPRLGYWASVGGQKTQTHKDAKTAEERGQRYRQRLLQTMQSARAVLVLAIASSSLWAGCSSDEPNKPSVTVPFDGGGAETATTASRKEVILLVGTVIGPEGAFDGQVLVEADRITCVGEGEACSGRAQAARATVVDTGGIIAPGLVDTHNHILFDVFDDSDWLPEQAYQNHDQWTAEPRYGAMLDTKQCLANDSQGKPAWCAQTPYGTKEGSVRCEMDKWGELKALVAGTTSIVGLPGTSAACFGSLARSIDVAQNGLKIDRVRTSATFPPSNATATSVCESFANKSVDAFLVHCGEGVDDRSRAEFAKLGSAGAPAGCLYAPGTAITHGTAFTANEFAIMGSKGMKLTWSPASNMALYGATTNVPLALDAKVLVALAPDWSMGGSQNLLDELRFARAHSQKNWGGRLDDKTLVTMATANGAEVVALGDRIGRIKEGYIADIAVFAGDASRPYGAIVAATPKEVRLVMVGGVVLYGDKEFESLAATNEAPGCETIDVCGASKFLCVATGDTNDKLGQTFAKVKEALEQAMTASDKATPDDGYDFAPLAPLVRCAK